MPRRVIVGLNELMHMKPREQKSAHNACSIKVNCNYCYYFCLDYHRIVLTGLLIFIWNSSSPFFTLLLRVIFLKLNYDYVTQTD